MSGSTETPPVAPRQISQALDILRGGGTLFNLSTRRPVRLTTMYLDGNPMNCEHWNLVTACRSCHAAYDAREVTAARANAGHWALLDAGQLELFPDLA